MILGVVFVCCLSRAALADDPLLPDGLAGIASPEALWHNFDPEALPLEVESIRTWTEEDCRFETLRFTGEIVDGQPVRVYAIQGAPAVDRRFPGVLHVHGGGQTASLEWVKFWARRGYVCVSFDFCGPWQGRTAVTDWGPLKHANMEHAAGGFQLRPTPRESSWYHWALVSRRALTLLARHPRVDAERLGVFGISVGGSLTWMIAGFDRRVKAAVPIYGCGYNYDRRNVEWGLPGITDDLALFQRVLSPEAHAPYVGCPTLFLNATNDFHGLMDRGFETLAAVKAPVRQAFTPRYNHHIEPQQGKNLPLWMDWHLNGGAAWPKTPRLELTLDERGVVQATVAADQPETVDVHYALGDKRPQARFWRQVRPQPTERGLVAELPVMDTWERMHVFATVTYKSGVSLTSELRPAIPAQLGKARATLERSTAISHGDDGVDHWYFTNGYTDPSLDWSYLRSGNDDDAGPFVSFQLERFGDPVSVRLSTHILGDPQFQGRDGESLAFKCQGGFTTDGLTVTLVEDDWSPRARRFTVKLPREDLGPDWKEVILPLSRFVDAQGQSPARWKQIDKLELQGDSARSAPPKFASLRWVLP
ncbi:MAG: acetylxylan esterase [Planctomycetia bacterium]|nr:acetylxylan esterase [Planctomycetia bacterium]